MRLLLTAAGTGTAFSYAIAAAQRTDINLITADTNCAQLVTAALFASRHVVLPRSQSPEFAAAVAQVVRDEAVDVYLPLIDAEAAWAADAGLPSVRIATNSGEFCRAALAKSRYHELTDGSLVRVPRSLSRSEAKHLSRFVAKRDGSFGGRDTRIVNDGDVASLAPDLALSEFIDGDEFTVDCFPFGNDTLTSVRERLETKAGVCTKARIGRDETLTAFARQLAARFSLTHPFCFQTRRDAKGHALIDLNPRLGAGSAMSAVNGMDFFAAHLAMLTGGDPLAYLVPRHAECIVTRQYANYLTGVGGV
jgi:hypothetical protein